MDRGRVRRHLQRFGEPGPRRALSDRYAPEPATGPGSEEGMQDAEGKGKRRPPAKKEVQAEAEEELSRELGSGAGAPARAAPRRRPGPRRRASADGQSAIRAPTRAITPPIQIQTTSGLTFTRKFAGGGSSA